MRQTLREKCAVIAIVAATILALPVLAWASHYKTRYLHSFCIETNCPDGASPQSGPLVDAAGNIFVTTGTAITELVRKPSGGWHFKVLYAFCIVPNCTPYPRVYGRLIIDKDGNLYGTMDTGGKYSTGFVYELEHNASGRKWKIKNLYDFCYVTPDGCASYPFYDPLLSKLTYAGESAGVPYDGVSALFGTNHLSAFMLLHDGKRWKGKTIYEFCSLADCTDGKYPNGVILDSNGNLFGTTSGGGPPDGFGGPGVAFELSPSGGGRKWTETVLHDFCSEASCADGKRPYANLLMDATGNLFGTASAGGAYQSKTGLSAGVIFKLVPNGTHSEETVLHSFCRHVRGYNGYPCPDGSQPQSTLTMDASGNLFGTTYYGGTEGFCVDEQTTGGTVFEMASDGTYSVRRSYTKSRDDGCNPGPSLAIDASGDLIGTTRYGGTGDQGGMGNYGGTVFELKPR